MKVTPLKSVYARTLFLTIRSNTSAELMKVQHPGAQVLVNVKLVHQTATGPKTTSPLIFMLKCITLKQNNNGTFHIHDNCTGGNFFNILHKIKLDKATILTL